MKKIDYLVGDVLEMDFKHLLHGCNCRNIMGAGIAKKIADKWPDVKLIDSSYRRIINKDKSLLGSFSRAFIYGKQFSGRGASIYNLYTQLDPGPCFDIKAFEAAIVKVFNLLTNENDKEVIVHMPLIGCGLGGGKWIDVEAVLTRVIYWYPNIYVKVVTLEAK
jgi:O-acetyl-ADP-ribose deacetylase (regulator of RNase III)